MATLPAQRSFNGAERYPFADQGKLPPLTKRDLAEHHEYVHGRPLTPVIRFLRDLIGESIAMLYRGPRHLTTTLDAETRAQLPDGTQNKRHVVVHVLFHAKEVFAVIALTMIVLEA